MVVERTPVRHPMVVSLSHFPFGQEFQKALLKLLTLDVEFASAAMPYLEPSYFENEVLAWAYFQMAEYRKKYNAIPQLRLILEETRALDPKVREVYMLTLEQVLNADLSGEEWLRDRLLDFIKRNLFVEAFRHCKDAFNGGKVDDAFSIWVEGANKIQNVVWKKPDREFFFDEFAQRYSKRLSEDPQADSVATAIPELDHILGGGLRLGEMGVWVAYPKRGKTTMLANLGVQAVRRGEHNVLHVVFEGSRKIVAARYDTIFSAEEYQKVKQSGISEEAFQRMKYDYQMFSHRLVLRGFTDAWDYTAENIDEELRELKRLYNWVPALIIVDYGDLLKGRGRHDTETESQRQAYRDLKTLANRGYALWTASQAQRPKTDIEFDPEPLQSRKIADCYDKVRVADFIGSINMTREEKLAHQMRLYAELYRDNEAGFVIPVKADFSKMTITTVRTPGESVLPGPAPIPLGYTKPRQKKAPI